ncbi:MAG: hypothetical protein ACKONH_07945 [Planctomycetia bacterium]
MNRDDLLALCRGCADRRHQIGVGRVTVEFRGRTVDPVPEIIRSFRLAEISESEKNSLLSLICDPEESDFCAETACVRDPYADEQDGVCDDDELG